MLNCSIRIRLSEFFGMSSSLRSKKPRATALDVFILCISKFVAALNGKAFSVERNGSHVLYCPGENICGSVSALLYS